ncbi:MAG TPA: AAA family ATPase [Thermoanaerobaculia bacterium]|jgi:chromosome partitioning protein
MRIAIISKKGGVGKTTTAVNLAAALALQGKRVLLVDLDPNAGASLSLGLAKSELVPGAADVMLRNLPAHEAVRTTRVEGLAILPASVDLRSAEIELDVLFQKERVLHERLASIDGDYDFVFFDCPPSLGLLTRNAVVAGDAFLVPATPHFLALEGLEHLVATAERLSLGAGRGIRFLGVVFTGVDYRISTTRGAVRRLRDRFGARAFAVEIRTNVCLAEAPAFGQTVFEYSPASTGARAYSLLAEEILLFHAAAEPAPLAVA